MYALQGRCQGRVPRTASDAMQGVQGDPHHSVQKLSKGHVSNWSRPEPLVLLLMQD